MTAYRHDLNGVRELRITGVDAVMLVSLRAGREGGVAVAFTGPAPAPD